MAPRTQLWRCFHCNETFTDRRLAEDHFGISTMHPAACVDPLRSDEKALRERAMFYERAWRKAIDQRDEVWRKLELIEEAAKTNFTPAKHEAE